MKISKYLPIIILLCTIASGCGKSTSSEQAVVQPEPTSLVDTNIESSPAVELTTTIQLIDKHGNIDLTAVKEDYITTGIEPGDIVCVCIGNKTITMPVGTSVTDVNAQENVLVLKENKSALYCNTLSFAENEGIAEKQIIDGEVVWQYTNDFQDPVTVSVTLCEKGGYLEQWQLHQLTRTNSREDYPQLSDSEFANFRCISTTGMADNVLYRSSSPITSELKRNTYCDTACREAGINAVLNLCHTKTTAESSPYFNDSYYSSCNIVFAPILLDLKDPYYQEILADGIRKLIETEPPYLIHCIEGKDRTGLVCALLEGLTGATLDDIKSDYLITYWNFNGVEPESEKAQALYNANIYKSLTLLFGVDSLDDNTLQAESERFFSEIGLKPDEIQLLKTRLTTK